MKKSVLFFYIAMFAVSLHLFLYLVPFLDPLIYSKIIFLNFSVASPISLITLLIFLPGIRFEILFFALTAALYFFDGAPGSVIGYLLSAALGHLFGEVVAHHANDKNHQTAFFFQSFILSLINIIFSIRLLFYTGLLSNDELGDMFQVASVNYAVITAGCVALYTSLVLTMSFERGLVKKIYQLYLLKLIVACNYMLTIILAVHFSTRSVLLLGIPLVAMFSIVMGIKKKITQWIILILPVILVVNSQGFLDKVGFYDSTLGNLVLEEDRLDSAVNFLIHSFRNGGLRKVDGDLMSYSGLVNLIGLLAPSSIIIVVYLLNVLIFWFKSTDFLLNLHGYRFLALAAVFLLSVYQPDMLSVFTFFFLIPVYVSKINDDQIGFKYRRVTGRSVANGANI